MQQRKTPHSVSVKKKTALLPLHVLYSNYPKLIILYAYIHIENVWKNEKLTKIPATRVERVLKNCHSDALLHLVAIIIKLLLYYTYKAMPHFLEITATRDNSQRRVLYTEAFFPSRGSTFVYERISCVYHRDTYTAEAVNIYRNILRSESVNVLTVGLFSIILGRHKVYVWLFTE